MAPHGPAKGKGRTRMQVEQAAREWIHDGARMIAEAKKDIQETFNGTSETSSTGGGS